MGSDASGAGTVLLHRWPRHGPRQDGQTGDRKFADYLLFHKPNIPIAIIEAKDNNHSVGSGMQQGLEYAGTLDIPFVFSTNGDGFLLHDRLATSGAIEEELPLNAFLRRRKTPAATVRPTVAWCRDMFAPDRRFRHSALGGVFQSHHAERTWNSLSLTLATGDGLIIPTLPALKPDRRGDCLPGTNHFPSQSGEEFSMSDPCVVTELCHNCKHTDCVTACPVDCFYQDDDMLYIHQEDCIGCDNCIPLCPEEAIFSVRDLPVDFQPWIEVNAERAEELKTAGATITRPQEPKRLREDCKPPAER